MELHNTNNVCELEVWWTQAHDSILIPLITVILDHKITLVQPWGYVVTESYGQVSDLYSNQMMMLKSEAYHRIMGKADIIPKPWAAITMYYLPANII